MIESVTPLRVTEAAQLEYLVLCVLCSETSKFFGSSGLGVFQLLFEPDLVFVAHVVAARLAFRERVRVAERGRSPHILTL